MSENRLVSVSTLSHNDLPPLHPAYHFNGSNYPHWAQLVRTTLKGCSILNHIEQKSPFKDDPGFKVWDIEDAIIITWLLNSMTQEIGRNCIFFSTAKEIWEHLQQIYFVKQNIPACYELENRIMNTKQGVHSVIDYYLNLNGLWNELDQYNKNFKMECHEDNATLKQFIERSRVFKFLSGLNSEFYHIRVQILEKDKLPNLLEAFNIVRAEESRVMGAAKSSSEDRWCSHCGKSNHNFEMCFKLHGKEKVLGRVGGFKGLSKKGTNQTVKDSKIVKDGMVLPQGEREFSKPLSKEELERLQALMDSLNRPSSTYSGKNSSFLSFYGSGT
jgi:hypothetical protein